MKRNVKRIMGDDEAYWMIDERVLERKEYAIKEILISLMGDYNLKN